MAELRTEEEQVEAIKNWWQENGKSLVIVVALSIAGVFGWRAWQSNQEATAANASALYENLAAAVESSPSLDEAQASSVGHIAKQLKEDYGSSAYAPMGAMILARVLVEKQDYSAALAELEYVIESEQSKASLAELATLRKAQILLSEAKLNEAKAALSSIGESIYMSLFYEISGDIAAASGDAEAARSAYQVAMDNSDPQTRSLIKMKFDDLATGES